MDTGPGNDDTATGDDGVLERLSRVCNTRIAPRAARADREGWSRESWEDLAEVGFFKLVHPRSIGGLGLSGIDAAIAIETVASACAGTAWSASISTLLFGKTLAALARTPRHREVLAGILEGTRMGCVGITEDRSMCDAANAIRSTLRRVDGGYLLNGDKTRISNGARADVCVAFVRPDDGERARGDLVVALVDLRRPGVVQAPLEASGLRAQPWGSISFRDVAIAEEDVFRLPAAPDALTPVAGVTVVLWGQFLSALLSVGIAQAALDASIAYTANRPSFGMPLIDNPLVHARLVDMKTDIEGARLLTQRAAERAWRIGYPDASMQSAKLFATEAALRVTTSAVHLHGGAATSTASVVERLYRDCPAPLAPGGPNDRLREMGAALLVGADVFSYEPMHWLGETAIVPGT